MKYYHCVEDDKVYSSEKLLSDFIEFQAEGYYQGETFPEYLEGCMWWNNGSLTPLLDHITYLRRELNRVRSFDDEWTESIRSQITEYEKLYLEV